MFQIYLVTNTVNGKLYVGKTSRSLQQRWKEHKQRASSENNYFHKAILKYNPQSFSIQEIAYADNEQEANNLERLWILCLETYKPEYGYNSTFGGDGVICTKETRLKISQSLKGFIPVYNPMKGKHWSEDHKKYLSKINSGSNSPLYRHDIKNEQIVELLKAGNSHRKIAKILNTNKITIQNRIRAIKKCQVQ